MVVRERLARGSSRGLTICLPRRRAACVCASARSFREHATRTHSNAIPHYNLGLLYEEKGDYTAAAASFHRALELFPTHGES